MRGGPTLVLPAPLHEAIVRHVIVPDGLEVAAIVLCSRVEGQRLKLLGRELIPVPLDDCERRENFLSWPGEYIENAIDRAEEDDLSIMLVHSHPGGYYRFSHLDDASDRAVMPALFAGRPRSRSGSIVHGSAIVMPCGAIRGRLYQVGGGRPEDLELVAVPGDDLRLFWAPSEEKMDSVPPRPMAFSSQMKAELSRLSACVIGVSGTGSLVAEQLARLGIGELILVDFDTVEHKNLNRIVNSTIQDAEGSRLKVEMFAAAVATYSPSIVVRAIPSTIATKSSVRQAADADLLFSCVDSSEGRQICDLMGQAFAQPLFDVGVTIPVRKGSTGPVISDVVGRVDYVQPGGSSLFDRKVFTSDSLGREYLRRTAPDAYQRQLEEGYLKGVAEEAPSVISLNMRAASACVMEFIARAFPFRLDPNRQRSQTIFSLAACEEDHTNEAAFVRSPNHLLAVGLKEPLLGLALPEAEPVR